ncbi:efflux RND transporter permease subunit [Halovenus sp. HT40]|uniref:efflux RND transporter permease subunit n=1 Tax=Halovenus sp. HT40 TaxID=3126691 RepID=UPI00300ED5F4
MSIERLVAGISRHRRLLIVLFLALTGGFAVSATTVEQTEGFGGFQTESEASDALNYIEGNFSAEANATTAQVIIRGENVLDRETLTETLAYQQDLRRNETVNATLTDDPFGSVANAVAVAAIQRERGQQLRTRQQRLNETERELSAALDSIRAGDHSIETEFAGVRANTTVEFSDRQVETFTDAARSLRTAENESAITAAYRQGTVGVLAPEYERLDERRQRLDSGLDPSLADQRRQLSEMDDTEIEQLVSTVLDAENNELLSLMPSGYEPGETEAEATALLVTQDTGGEYIAPDTAPDSIIDAQYEMRAIGEQRSGEYLVFGSGITANEINSAISDSLSVVGPLALLFVMVVLTIAYRDPVDILLGFGGIVAVLIWTIGFMGLANIEFSQIFIAVPVLLIGLSIDYAIHVFMRGREARTGTERSVEEAMFTGLAAVGFALVLVTVTAAAGFLSNVVSPLPPIRKFGIVNAFGIVAALCLFGVLVPALKVEIDTALERHGIDRQKSAFGTSGLLEPVMRTGEILARRGPAVVLAVVLVISLAGAYGGTQVDTTFDTDEFMPDEPPRWTDNLPDSLQPAEYSAKSTIEYLDETFLRQSKQAQILVEGDPTDPAFLEAVHTGEQRAANTTTTAELPNGARAVQGPVETMQQVAATDAQFNETFTAADTDGDGVPEENLTAVYDALFDADEGAATVLHRADGEYESARIITVANGDATQGEITEEMRAVATAVESEETTATATGQQTVLNYIIEQNILETVVQSLLATLLSVGLLLMVVYRLTEGSATLGLVTTAPVVLALSWVLGTMYVLGIGFNSITGMITSLTIGLGVAYSIHVSQRYRQELDQRESVWEALRTTVTGTGGALLGSAATTAGGFGVLMLAFLPSLQQFGFITAISILYAFLASVLVLPTLLVVWTRLAGPKWARTELRTRATSAESVPDPSDDD